MNDIRIGQGFDVHKFENGRPLILGGVTIAHEQGLAGHSDADVLLHAISDALLGALALGDIGQHFPDTDPTYKNANSRKLLRKVVKLIDKKKFKVVNLDCTIIAQAPKMMPYIKQMRELIADDLNIKKSRVSVKATTTETLGFTGRGEGIASQAVVLLSRKQYIDPRNK